MMNIDDKLKAFESAHLFHGSHKSMEDGACAMEWASYLANEPFSDQPQCVCPVIRSYVISLNDGWSDADRDRLKPYIPRTLNTRTNAETETRRAIAALDWTMRVHRPLWFDAACLSEHAAIMRALPEIVDEATFKAAADAQEKAIAAAWAARAARAARDAWDAWAARAARDAWDAWDAWATWDAWAARAAWAARDARAAWAAWAAWAARAAWDAVAGLVVVRSWKTLSEPTQEQRIQAGVEALNAVAAQVRTAELELLERMIAVKP